MICVDAYTIPEAADRAGVAPRAIREAIENGRVRAFRDAGRWRIPAAELERVELLDSDPEGLEELQERLGEIERRLEALETGAGDGARARASMRPALAHLFSDADPEPAPEVEPTVRSLGASRILSRMPDPDDAAG